MHKINLITNYFIMILQRNNELVIFGKLDIPGHTHTKSDGIILNKLLRFAGQRIEFTLQILHEILQRYCTLVILGTLEMSGYAHPK